MRFTAQSDVELVKDKSLLMVIGYTEQGIKCLEFKCFTLFL